MFKVVEVEKVGAKWVERKLYAGDCAQSAERIAHFETQAYHRRKDVRKDGELVITLTVDS